MLHEERWLGEKEPVDSVEDVLSRVRAATSVYPFEEKRGGEPEAPRVVDLMDSSRT